MLPSICVVVPTYWTRSGGQPRDGDAVYDHPTAVDGKSTLTPLLQSLERLDTSSFYLLLLVAVTGDDVVDIAEQKVREIAAQYPSLVTLIFGPSQMGWLNAWLTEKKLHEASHFLALRKYPNIRNLQLALPLALGSKAIVALDDDEIVTDPEFIPKAVEPLGTLVHGRRVDGLSGHYLQENGGILLQVDPAKAKSSNLFDRKAEIMNRGTEVLETQPGDLVETPFCFGGNMEFTPELASAVGFDPEITRGEDIDYLINARMEDRNFFLRKDLRILHCPPSGGSYKDVSTSKLEQDVIRFLYEKEKLRVSQENTDLHAVTAAELRPYPGDFLEGDLGPDAAAALQHAGYVGDAEAFIVEAQTAAAQKMRNYLRFRLQWPRATAALMDAPDVRDRLSALVQGL